VIRDRGQWAELAVLATVLAIAALASYIHLREVWLHAGAPVAAIGPLTVDGLFAAAWLRMRRRRGQGERVGFLAWLALGLALVATVAGNLAAAVIADHRDPLSLVVAAWPAVAFAVVWELVTGHSRQTPASATAGAGGAAESNSRQKAGAAGHGAGDGLGSAADESADQTPETWEQKRDRLLAEGAGRPRLIEELAITDYAAKSLQREWRERQATQEEAAG
jgi:hypothetical protein